MRAKRYAVGLAVALLAGLGGASAVVEAGPAEQMTGILTDEEGRPIEAATVQVCGLEKQLPDGRWDRNHRPHCLLPKAAIEPGGHFTVPFDEENVRANLWVGKEEFAPAFVGGVVPQLQEVKVVLKRGVQVSGHVSHRVGGKLEPVQRAAVYLGCSSGDLAHQKRVFDDPYFFVMNMKEGDDLPYLQHTFTGAFGEYVFQISPPPANKTWFLVCMDKMVPLQVKEGLPVQGPDFVVQVQVR
jgi:hypothetical protein